MIRWPVVFVLLGLVAAGLAYDNAVDLPVDTVAQVDAQPIVSPSMTDPPHLDGAWYCPIGSTAPGSYAIHEVQISNLGVESAVANLQILTGDGPGPSRRIELPALSTERVVLSETQVTDIAGAVVEITGGRGAVGHSVQTERGLAEGPCATEASNSWYFASGRTSFDSTQYLALMNPFPETAVFDIEFQGVGRTRKPSPLQSAFVKARSVRIVNVGEFARTEDAVATKVTTARGRLVVERLQLMDGQLGPEGAALQLGVPTPAKSWIFTAGRVHESGEDLLTIYNPFDLAAAAAALAVADQSGNSDPDGTSDGDADDSPAGTEADGAGSASAAAVPEREGFLTVSVELWPTNPSDLSTYSVVTIEREIRPGTFIVIDLRAQAERFEFPLPYELGVNVTSNEGLPIVAERWQMAKRLEREGVTQAEPEDTGETEPGQEGDVPEGAPADFQLQPPEPVDPALPQPIATQGISTTRGTELFSTRWVIPWVTTSGDSTLIAVSSIEEASVEVSILNSGALIGPIRATVPAGGRTIIPVASPDGGAAMEIVSDTPIAAEAVVVIPDVTLDVIPAIPTISG